MPLIRVFDLGNVLLLHDAGIFFRRVGPRCREREKLAEVVDLQYDRLGVGEGGSFEEMYRAIKPEIGLDMGLEEFREAWNDIFELNPPMLEVVRQSPRPRFLLSNTNEPHVRWIRERFPVILPLFDACVLSNEVGVSKPEEGIYRHVEQLSGERPERHVFIDDLAENVEGARAVGWHGIVFRGVEDCLERLAEVETGGERAGRAPLDRGPSERV